MKTFKVTTEIKTSLINDVLITALEGGSNYWYFINEHEAETPENFKRDPEMHYEFLDKVYQGGSLPVYDAEDNSELHGTLTIESIQKGLNILAKDHETNMYNISTEDYDAHDADVFFQLCVLGEITFG